MKTIGAWLSLVERLVRDQEAGGSNPLAPTIPSFDSFHLSATQQFQIALSLKRNWRHLPAIGKEACDLRQRPPSCHERPFLGYLNWNRCQLDIARRAKQLSGIDPEAGPTSNLD